MRIDPDACRDPDLLAAEVRRLRAVIESGKPVLTDAEREAMEWALDEGVWSYGDPEDWTIAERLRALLRRLLGRTETGEK
jgi:hypothetical protein